MIFRRLSWLHNKVNRFPGKGAWGRMVMGTEIIKPKYHNISLSVLKENPVENQKRRVAMVRDRGLTAVGRRTEKETLGVVGEGGAEYRQAKAKIGMAVKIRLWQEEKTGWHKHTKGVLRIGNSSHMCCALLTCARLIYINRDRGLYKQRLWTTVAYTLTTDWSKCCTQRWTRAQGVAKP